MDDKALGAACVTALRGEAAAIEAYAAQGGAAMADAVRLIHAAPGPLIVAGIGKSGHIAGKLASTFRSIGKAAIFLHPAEASHGDLGLVTRDSVLLILSNTGETSELSDLLHFARVHGNPIVALTGIADSTLAKAAAVTIAYGRVTEVCANGLAPTTSTTLALAIGDALAVGVTHLLGTAAEDFRRYHPGGKLGAMLLTVEDLMVRGDDLPVVAPDLPMMDTMMEMSAKALGLAVVVSDGAVAGIITDGDLRRNMARLMDLTAGEVATANPVSVRREARAVEALDLMTQRKITAVLVMEDGRLAGVLKVQDVLRAGVRA
ncbi:MAG: KpsF/GutQ family sugar-phosphate isomerase [Pseudomonadota bacterium]